MTNKEKEISRIATEAKYAEINAAIAKKNQDQFNESARGRAAERAKQARVAAIIADADAKFGIKSEASMACMVPAAPSTREEMHIRAAKNIEEARVAKIEAMEAAKVVAEKARVAKVRAAKKVERKEVVDYMVEVMMPGRNYEGHREDGYPVEVDVNARYKFSGKYSRGGFYFWEDPDPREQAFKEHAHFTYHGAAAFIRVYGERWEVRATRRNAVVKAERIARTNKFMARRKTYIAARTRYIAGKVAKVQARAKAVAAAKEKKMFDNQKMFRNVPMSNAKAVSYREMIKQYEIDFDYYHNS